MPKLTSLLSKLSLRAWDCDTCIADVTAVTEIFMSDEAAAGAVMGLDGKYRGC